MNKILAALLLTSLPVAAIDSVVVFNEIHYHPAGDNSSLEYVELYNQLAADVDLSNWKLDGDISFNFPEGTVLGGGEYLVIAKDPTSLAAATGFSSALGPFDGILSNSGKPIFLYNNNRSFSTATAPPPTLPANKLWSVDLQGDGNGGNFGQLSPPVTMSGIESSSGLGNIWNAFSIPGHDGTAINPSMNLVDSAGAASGVSFSITGTVTGWSQNGSNLVSDYLFLNAGKSDTVITWEISGLTPGEIYTFYGYGGVSRDIQLTLDRDGNGSLVGETSFNANSAGLSITNITAGASGTVIGSATRGSVSEGNWGGFQIFEEQALAGPSSGGVAHPGLEARRIMDLLDFSDTVPWPLGPDGSGFTLGKIDPTTATSQPENWKTSGQSNGSPGAGNTFGSLPSLSFNEITSVFAPTFGLEIYNYGPSPLSLNGFIIASSDPIRSDYIIPNTTLNSGEFHQIEAVDFGYVPSDNDRLYFYTVGKTQLIDTIRADNSAQARFPDGSGPWLRPTTDTIGSANMVTLQDSIVINEIFYHAYPIRQSPGTPGNTVDHEVLDFDSIWRYNLDAGAAGLPSNWATIAHPVDGASWTQGPGLLGSERGSLAEPIQTDLTLSLKIPYYFETEFTYTGAEVILEMEIEHFTDDGAVFYLNGVELDRFNMADGAILPTTNASISVSNASLQTLTIPSPNILNGTNRLSVEVHQINAGSSDMVWGGRVVLKTSDGTGTESTAYAEREEEWLELYNQSGADVNLSNWSLEGGISHSFDPETILASGGYLVVAKNASALAAKHPGITIQGDYSGQLANSGELIILSDHNGNPADQVHYHDSGKWHQFADGGGSSLELREPNSDNAVAGAWSPSDESSGSAWHTYTYEDVAVNDGIGNNTYHEFLIALLEAGEFLLDDVSVIENNSIEFIQNGDFEGDTIGGTASKWRALGTHGSHGRSVVVNDPDSPGNQCLHVVATGPTEDKHNKIETTFASSERVVLGNTYTISFRAKWLTGSNQVNSRLYFNYLQKTHLLDLPEIWGTPGTVNSTATGNVGPTLTQLSHSPAVPNSGQATTVTIAASDPNGINNLTLKYSVNGAAFQFTSMTSNGEGIYSGIIPGQSASRIVRFYVEASDQASASSLYPSAGAEGGAFYKVQDNLADNTGLRHNFRIIMSDSDRSFLFRNTNRMSNDRFSVTVIEDESTVYYDVGLRLKASGFGRFNSGHYGFNIRFQPDQLFRGVHKSVSIERSPNLKEILAKHLMNRAGGGYWSFYDDVAYIIPPTTNDRGVGLISMARQTETFFDGLFPDTDESGTLFNHELLYNPSGTNGGAEGLKIGNPYNHTNGRYNLADRGPNKEPYRWGFQIRSSRGKDDYSQLVALNQAMNLSGSNLKTALDDLIDVDQWMRTFAMMSLNGTDDVFSRIWEHNFRYYVRPTDGKIIIFQWDLDRSFQLGATSSVPPNRNSVTKLFSIPQYRRIFDGHLNDLTETTFNTTYVSPWASHFTTLTGDNLNGLPAYVSSRATHIENSLPSQITFAITSNGGSDFSVNDSAVTLAGDGWIDVFSIEINDFSYQPTWTDADSWQLTVPIPIGATLLSLKAYNNQGLQVGADSITVTNTSAIDLASASNTIIREFHYHPSDPISAEIAQGFLTDDEFEFIEILNINPTTIVDLSGVTFADGIDYTFPQGTTLAPNARLIIASNVLAFEFRYGAGIATIAGEYSGHLRNSGEHVRLDAANGLIIADFTYGDSTPWPESADGDGYSLVFSGTDPDSPLAWRTSIAPEGNPGSDNSQPFTGSGDEILDYALASPVNPLISGDFFQVSFLQNLAAEDALVIAEYSTDLQNWIPFAMADFHSRLNQGNGTSLLTYTSPIARSAIAIQFVRLRVLAR
jgi:hypothetical protein